MKTVTRLGMTRAEFTERDRRLLDNKHAAEQFLDDASAIKEAKGYKHGSYQTWADYCQRRLGYTPQHVNELLGCRAIVERVAPESEDASSVVRPNVRQAKALAKAPPEQQAEVWADAVEQHGEKVTAAKVAEKVAEKDRGRRLHSEVGQGKTPSLKPPKVTAAVIKSAVRAHEALARLINRMGVSDECQRAMATVLKEIRGAGAKPTKPPGRSLSPKMRKAAERAHEVYCMALKEAGLFDEFSGPLQEMADRINTA